MLIEATTQVTWGNVYILSGDDDLHVGAGVTIQCTWSDPDTHTGADAVIAWTGTHTVTVDGTIIGEDECINLVGCETAQTVLINAGGILRSGGDGVVRDADGVILDGLNSTMTNAGTIISYGSAASVIVRDLGTTTVSNSGIMRGDVSGVWNKFGTGTLVFNNTGRVESPNESYRGGVAVDVVTNKGTMIGTLNLAGGNDTYDGRGGTVQGQILGGDGNDRFLLSNKAETIDAGLGVDSLDLSFATVALTVNLANPALNLGAPLLGDTLVGFENVFGGTKADRLTGDDQDNLLMGNGGYDTMSGGLGDDVLDGGALRDYLTGGAGADAFVYLSKAGIGDIIYDFTSGSDVFRFEGSAYGYGDLTGQLDAADFVLSSTRTGRDATDHFVFRTTDNTLWFDADGSGRGFSSIMIADLQAGSTLTAADIWLV